jgi:glutathione S-transferase
MITIFCSANAPPFLDPAWIRDLRALWAAEEAGAAYRIHWLDVSKQAQREASYKAVNPFGIIPALTDGAFSLFESGAIVTYLCERAGALVPPSGTQERALYDQWCFAALNTVEPPVFQLMIATTLAKDAAWAKERAPQLRDAALARLAALDEHLSGRSYLLDAFSGADILMGHVLNFVADPSLVEGFANVCGYHARLQARPAYARARAAQAGGKNAALAT